MERVYNFSAGPAMLPEAVLKKTQTEMLNKMFCKPCSKTILQGLWKSMMRITPKSRAITASTGSRRL